jgi:hypothetical protein
LKEERKMKAYKFNHQDRRFAPWTALCVLGLIAAMVFVLPSVVFAQITGELSQDCDSALIGTEHVITALVSENGVPGATVLVGFYSTVPAGKYFAPASFDANGIATFSYQVDSPDKVEIALFWIDQNNANQWVYLDTITTNWTADEADLCSGSQQVLVGGRLTLNPKKKGALKIAVCGTDEFDVSNVDPKTVQLAGVAPWHWKQKDSRLCPDGKDGVVDLVLKFKNREVVEALEEDSLVELADGVTVDLVLAGELYDGTPFGGEWVADMQKDGKRHWKKEHHQKKEKKEKKDKESKK